MQLIAAIKIDDDNKNNIKESQILEAPKDNNIKESQILETLKDKNIIDSQTLETPKDNNMLLYKVIIVVELCIVVHVVVKAYIASGSNEANQMIIHIGKEAIYRTNNPFDTLYWKNKKEAKQLEFIDKLSQFIKKHNLEEYVEIFGYHVIIMYIKQPQSPKKEFVKKLKDEYSMYQQIQQHKDLLNIIQNCKKPSIYVNNLSQLYIGPINTNNKYVYTNNITDISNLYDKIMKKKSLLVTQYCETTERPIPFWKPTQGHPAFVLRTGDEIITEMQKQIDIKKMIQYPGMQTAESELEKISQTNPELFEAIKNYQQIEPPCIPIFGWNLRDDYKERDQYIKEIIDISNLYNEIMKQNPSLVAKFCKKSRMPIPFKKVTQGQLVLMTSNEIIAAIQEQIVKFYSD